MDWQAKINEAQVRIAPYIRRTPVMSVKAFGLSHEIDLKFEHLQHTGSFKARGAFNTLLSQDIPETGLVAASGGNHGAAVAYAGSQLGHKTRVYVPEMAGPAKINLIKNLGVDLQVVEGAYANALNAAKTYEADTGAMQIHAYDAPGTVAGQGTCAAEWDAQGLDADTVLIAVGGGGLISGMLGWFNGNRKVVAVEPATCNALHAAQRASQPVDVDVSGVAANALGARRIGGICFDLAVEHNVETVLVSDEAITQAQNALWQEMRQLVEPAGAAALAALMSGAYRPAKDERVAVLVCGGNIAPDPLQT